MQGPNFAPNPRNLLYRRMFDNLKGLLYNLSKNRILVKEEDEKHIRYSLENKPNTFIELRLVSDPMNPDNIFTLALLTHLDIIFQATIDFYMNKHNKLILNSWGDKTSKIIELIGKDITIDQIINVIEHFKTLFEKFIKYRDNIISTLFKKAKVIDDETRLRFREEKIEVFGGIQKFRFAIYETKGKFKVLFDDIFSQNSTSITNSIEKVAYYITQKYFNGNYEILEWIQVFSFSPYIIVSEIELEPIIEEHRKSLFFKKKRFKGYKYPNFLPIASFKPLKVKEIFYEFLNQFKNA